MELHKHHRRTDPLSNQKDETLQSHKKKDTILNSIFTHAREDLVPHLGPLFRATNTLNYYPQEWSTMETLILKKPGKLDYTTPAAW
jgi:hypothetical protein